MDAFPGVRIMTVVVIIINNNDANIVPRLTERVTAPKGRPGAVRLCQSSHRPDVCHSDCGSGFEVRVQGLGV